MYFIRQTTKTYPPLEQDWYAEIIHIDQPMKARALESETWMQNEAGVTRVVMGPYKSLKDADCILHRRWADLELTSDEGLHAETHENAVSIWVPSEADY